MDPRALARTYYDAIDDWDQATLHDVLDADFTQERGDRTFDSRTAFLDFMRDHRPRMDTRHDLDRVYDGPAGDVAVAGRLVATEGADAGEDLFHFLDVFDVRGGTIVGLRTFADGV